MTLPTNGITPEVIRDLMPPYHLSQDLLAATLLTIPAPPPNAPEAWRQARLTRLLSEIAAYRPADAAQARIAAQILGIRELADTITAQAHTGAPPLKELCRIARSTSELLRTANALERTLTRHQQNPVPFYGTVIHDEVDLKSLDAQWASRIPAAATPALDAAARPPAAPTSDTTPPRPAAPTPDAAATPTTTPAPNAVRPAPAAAPRPDTAPPRRAARPTPRPTSAAPTAPPETPARPAPPPTPAAPTTRPAAPGSDWTITRLDSGPGWSREVLRHRSATQAEAAE